MCNLISLPFFERSQERNTRTSCPGKLCRPHHLSAYNQHDIVQDEGEDGQLFLLLFGCLFGCSERIGYMAVADDKEGRKRKLKSA